MTENCQVCGNPLEYSNNDRRWCKNMHFIKIIDQTKRLRENRDILTQTRVLYFNIENAVFAAELKCPDEFRCEGGSACNFRKKGECIVPKIRELLGERVF
jgi:hypothetical protein